MLIPEILKIETTNRCNAQCLFCSHRFFDEKRLKDMPFELVKRLLDEAASWERKPDIQFSGFGEPTLYGHLVEAVDYCHQKGMKSHFYTNGMMMTPSLTEKLVQSGLTWFLLTVDARDKKTYEDLRIGLNFEAVEYNIKGAWKICKNSKTNMRLASVMCKENRNDITNIRNHWKGYAHSYKIIGEIPLVKGRTKYHPANYCRKKAWTQLLVRANGDVPFCCIDVLDEYTKIGNVKKRSMLEIFNSKEARDLRSRVQQGKNLPPMCKRICFSE